VAPKAETPKHLVLPVLVASRIDVGRLLNEVERIDNALMQLGLRHSGSEVKMPKTSQLMDQTIELNKLNLLQADDRQALIAFLTAVHDRAPVLHISFSADPNATFMEKLVVWLRREIHPQVLVTVGLQPTIAAGCIVRTTNKYFDFSLRKDFSTKRDLLVEQLATAMEPKPPEAPKPINTEGVVTT